MSTSTNQTLAVLIEAINQRAFSAMHYATEAAEALQRDQRNEAIGTLLVIEQDLELALQLYRAVIAVHRTMKEGAA